jgi:hypothetical protein
MVNLEFPSPTACAWPNKPSARKVMPFAGMAIVPPSVKLEMGLRSVRRVLSQGRSVNSREFITGMVPIEARRAVNRWKGLEPRARP